MRRWCWGSRSSATLLGNWLLLRRRFEPLDQLISSMEQIDLAKPEQRDVPVRRGSDSAEVQRLDARVPNG